MRVGVVGAGATGGYFGGLLARAGHDVTFVARGRQLDEISRRGLRLRTLLAGDFTVAAKAVGEVRGRCPNRGVLFPRSRSVVAP